MFLFNNKYLNKIKKIDFERTRAYFIKNLWSMTKEDTKKTFTIGELVEYEKAARIICKKHESLVKTYDGSLVDDENAVKKFFHSETIYNKIVNEMEKKLEEVWGD